MRKRKSDPDWISSILRIQEPDLKGSSCQGPALLSFLTGIIDRLYRLSYLTSFLTGLKMVIPGCFVWISVFFVHFF